MIYLLLCILMNTGVFVGFRLLGSMKLGTFQAIVVNYITCVVTGLLLFDQGNLIGRIIISSWKFPGFITGILFISTFYLMAVATQKFSITVSSIATKMSLIIPVIFSIFIFKAQIKAFDVFNYLGILAAFPAIMLASLKKEESPYQIPARGLARFLPLVIFLFSGVIDTTINYTSLYHLSEKDETLFPIVIFGVAATVGVIILIFKKEKLRMKNVTAGFLLGMVNYFSIYFLIKSLSHFQNDGAFVYSIVNIGIILASTFFSLIFFSEKLTRFNKAGIFIAILALLLLSYQELLQLL